MSGRIAVLALALAVASGLGPRVCYCQLPAFGIDDDADARAAQARAREARRDTVLPFAAAVAQSFSSQTWRTLRLSTAPALELSRLLHRGYYRSELLQVVLIAERAGTALADVVRRRDSGAALRALAADFGQDPEALHRDAEAARAAAETLLPGLSTAAAGPAEGAAAALSTATVVMPGGQVVRVELAQTPEQQQRGLMYRTELAADAGMLFRFDAERVVPFWMKNTWIDLDIVYLDSRGAITKVFRRVPRSSPATTDAQVARVHARGRYVLELPAGAALRYGLKVGQRLRLPPEAL